MSELLVNTIKKADGTGSLSVPAESGTVVTTASPSLGRRNLIINGAMQVAQRGTTATGGSTGTYYGGCDRWRVYQDGTVAYTLSKDSNSPNGFGSSLKIDVTTADATVNAADRVDLIYRFEGNQLQGIAKGTADAKQLTLSFWVSSPKTGVHTVEFFDNDNGRQISKTYTIATADTWEYKTITIPADTTGAFDDDNGDSFQIAWWLMAGSNYTSGTFNSSSWASNTNANRVSPSQVNVMDNTANNFYLTGVQLEVGSVATPFEHRSYGEELALCQRYFVRLGNGSYVGIASGVQGNATNSKFTLVYPVAMRSTPSCTQSELICTDRQIFDSLVSNISAFTGDTNSAYIQATHASGGAYGQGVILAVENTKSGYLQLDAEL